MVWEREDRRKFPRVMYPCMVKIKSPGHPPKDLLAHTENIGQGGLCVLLRQDLKLFTTVDTEIDLLDMEEHVRPQGKIVWVVRRKPDETLKPLFYSIGIEFTKVSKEDQDHLWRNLQQLIKKGANVSKPFI